MKKRAGARFFDGRLVVNCERHKSLCVQIQILSGLKRTLSPVYFEILERRPKANPGPLAASQQIAALQCLRVHHGAHTLCFILCL